VSRPPRYLSQPVSRRPRSRRSSYRRRRAGALAALAAVAVAAWLLIAGVPGSVDVHGARIVRYSIASRLVKGSHSQVGIAPPGHSATKRPLLVFLYGKGENDESNLSSNLFAALAALGSRAPDVVFPDGGEDSYWHNRADGRWADYVLDEVIPEAVRRLHADPHRIAIGGLSMGGFGAYDIALQHPGRFCAVAGRSVALWRSGSETAEGSFDSAEDFGRNDVLSEVAHGGSPLVGEALWLDVGTEDPFRSADSELVESLRARGHTVQMHVWAGGHEVSYWNVHWGPYMRFVADALAGCRGTG
jgi:S-formylglutathione hydrolase FrmB